MFNRRRPLALRRRRPVTLVQGAVTCFDYLAANPFMQLLEADLELRFYRVKKGDLFGGLSFYTNQTHAWRIQHQSQAVDSFRARSLLPSALQ
jgi:hypothetical protein